MSSTRSTILTALETELKALSDVKQATLKIPTISEIEDKLTPYIGIVAGDELTDVNGEDGYIRYSLDIFIFIITEQQYTGIESLIDSIKAAIYDPTTSLTLTSNVLDKNITSFEPVQLEDFDSERYSNVRATLNLKYYADKDDF